MARLVDPNTGYRMRPHKVGGYLYASTQRVIEEDGVEKRRYFDWGNWIPTMFLRRCHAFFACRLRNVQSSSFRMTGISPVFRKCRPLDQPRQKTPV